VCFSTVNTRIILLRNARSCTIIIRRHATSRAFSVNSRLIIIIISPQPANRLNRFCRRRFAVEGPSTWNSLPDGLRDPELSLSTFKRQLKTYVFTRHSCTGRYCCGAY